MSNNDKDIIERLAKLIEPTLWSDPHSIKGIVYPQYNANVKGLKFCARKKAKRVLDAGYAHSDEIPSLRQQVKDKDAHIEILQKALEPKVKSNEPLIARYNKNDQ